jgi:4-coumarate--CoA ligase
MAVDKSHDVALFTSATPYPASLNDADTIWHLVFSTPPSDPNTPLYIDAATDESFSWRDFRELTKRLGLALRKSGLQPGQCVCIFAPNSPEFALLFWSAQVAGLLVTFANPVRWASAHCSALIIQQAYVPDELNHVLRDSSVAAVFVDSDSERVGRQSAQESGVKPDRVIHLQKGHRNSIWDMLDACGGQQLEPPHISPQDAIRTTALRCYSSGTTGKPKGVNLTHHNCHHALYQQAITQTELYARDVGHRYLAYMPLYHIAGIGVYLFHNVKVGPFLSGPFEPISQRPSWASRPW